MRGFEGHGQDDPEPQSLGAPVGCQLFVFLSCLFKRGGASAPLSQRPPGCGGDGGVTCPGLGKWLPGNDADTDCGFQQGCIGSRVYVTYTAAHHVTLSTRKTPLHWKRSSREPSPNPRPGQVAPGQSVHFPPGRLARTADLTLTRHRQMFHVPLCSSHAPAPWSVGNQKPGAPS